MLTNITKARRVYEGLRRLYVATDDRTQRKIIHIVLEELLEDETLAAQVFTFLQDTGD